MFAHTPSIPISLPRHWFLWKSSSFHFMLAMAAALFFSCSAAFWRPSHLSAEEPLRMILQKYRRTARSFLIFVLMSSEEISMHLGEWKQRNCASRTVTTACWFLGEMTDETAWPRQSMKKILMPRAAHSRMRLLDMLTPFLSEFFKAMY